MRVLSFLSAGAVRLVVSLLAYTLCLGSFEIGLLVTARAQTVPNLLRRAAPMLQ
jgi:hypothetical protein